MGNYHAPFGKRTMEKGLHQQVPRQRPTSLGERPGETDREQSRHRAPGRLNGVRRGERVPLDGDDDRFLCAAGDDHLHRVDVAGVLLPMHDAGWDEHEVPGPGPPGPRPAGRRPTTG